MEIKIDGTSSERIKDELRNKYSIKDKDMKKSIKGQEKCSENLAKELETVSIKGKMKVVYEITITIFKGNSQQAEHMKDTTNCKNWRGIFNNNKNRRSRQSLKRITSRI